MPSVKVSAANAFAPTMLFCIGTKKAWENLTSRPSLASGLSIAPFQG